MKCFYCEKELGPEEVTQDHVVALSKGGVKNRINRVSCCEPCNVYKGSLPLNCLLQKIERNIKNYNPKKNKIPQELLPLIKVNVEFLIVNRLLVYKERLFKTPAQYDNY